MTIKITFEKNRLGKIFMIDLPFFKFILIRDGRINYPKY